MCKHNFTILAVLLALFSTVSLWGKPESDEKVAKHFNVTWDSIRYNKTVSIHNPAVSSTYQTNQTSEQFSLYCQIDIKNPKLVLGTSNRATVTDLQDDSGQKLKVPQTNQPSFADRYEGLRYRSRFEAPSGPDTWINKVRSFVGISPNKPNRPERVQELQPSRITINFDRDTILESTQKIGLLKGYFHALTAESVKYVDVPFEPSQNWVQLTPDTEIRISEAQSTGTSFRYAVETAPQRSQGMPYLMVGGPLPELLVVEYQLIAEDGKPINNHGPRGRLGSSLNAAGSGSGSFGKITKIRYKIAVNPSHHKIPFELKDIHLPKP